MRRSLPCFYRAKQMQFFTSQVRFGEVDKGCKTWPEPPRNAPAISPPHVTMRAPEPVFRQDPRGVFVDRWGTLLETPERGYCTHPDEVVFLPGAVDALFRASRAGWRVYLIGNEPSVAQGRLSDRVWDQVEERIRRVLESQGARIQRFYACLDHPEGKPPHDQDSVYLLPNTGAFYQAAHMDGIELRKSWVLGDGTAELVAGWRAGLRLGGVRTGQGLSDGEYDVDPEFVVADMATAISYLLEHETLRRAG